MDWSDDKKLQLTLGLDEGIVLGRTLGDMLGWSDSKEVGLALGLKERIMLSRTLGNMRYCLEAEKSWDSC